MRKSATKKTATKPAKRSAPKTARRARPARTDSARGVRPGSKLEFIVGLLKRKEGCTMAEVCKATGWKAVSLPPIARRAGIMIEKVDDNGETRYRAV